MSQFRPPPGPRGLPLLGSLHLLARDTHQAVNRIAREHGDVCMVRIGQTPTVIISHPTILEDAFNRPEFSGRWVSRAFNILTGRQSITTADHGEHWRRISELLHRPLSSPRSFAAIHDRQVVPAAERMVAGLVADAGAGDPVDVAGIIDAGSWEMTFAMMFGRDPADPDDYHALKAAMRQDTQWTVRAATQLSLGDLVPALRFVPDRRLSRVRRQNEIRRDTLRKLFDIVRGRPSFGRAEPSCIMDFMLNPDNELSDRTVETTCADMILASNPVASILKWWLIILANRPSVQRTIQEEMSGRMEPAEATADPARLPYTASCFDECMRYRTPAPLAVPHQATEDAELADFLIPAGAQILANIHGIHHDERFWHEPDTYRPDRFLCQRHTTECSQAFMPFSTGIRACAGRHLGRAVAWTAATSMVRNLTYVPPQGRSLSEREVFGLTLTPEPHSMLVTRRQT